MTRPVNLALQGGGAHGAFTWGVLDALLEDGRLRPSAVSGASAGAMNAVAFASGWRAGGRDGARESLDKFWRAVADAAAFSPLRPGPLDVLMNGWSLDYSPAYMAFDAATRMLSPYQFNPLNVNPLRDVLESSVDFGQARACDDIDVFISATNVETGRVKVFDPRALTPDMVMASACLPFMFQAVEIDGAPYWDGGYMGNPPLFPFNRAGGANDIMIVQINPISRPGVPRTAAEIMNRINEITFNASLLKELRAIEFMQRLVADGAVDRSRYHAFNIHIVENQAVLNPLGAASKLNAEWRFLLHLRDAGRAAAAAWLARNFEAVGRRSTVDLRAMFASTEPDAPPSPQTSGEEAACSD